MVNSNETVPRNGRRPHILVVDGTPEILDLLQELLEEEGYRVTPCREALDLEQVKALAPDVIIQDLLFEQTQERGWTFLTLVRLDPELSAIPLILCTAAMHVVKDEEIAEKLRQMGLRVVLNPFQIAELLAAISEALGERTRELDVVGYPR